MESDPPHNNPAASSGPAPTPENAPPVVISSTAIARLREIAGDDATFLKEVFAAYQTDTARRLVELRTALAARDAKGIKRAAHTIKGSSLNVGAETLTAYCRQLEQIAESGKLDTVNDFIARIDRESKQVGDALNRLL